MLLINQLHGGGAEKVIANLSLYLPAEFNITVVIYNDLNNPVLRHKGELVKIKLPYDFNPARNSMLKRFIRVISLIRKLRKIKKEKKIDVTISFLEASNIANVLSGTGEKIILSVRSYLSREFSDSPRLKIFSLFIRILYNKADYVVCPAQLIKADLVNNFKVRAEKVALAYNFIVKQEIETGRRSPIPVELENIFKDKPVIINVGRVSSPKAQWLLMPVMRQVKQKIPGVRLVIAGDGPLTQKLIDTAKSEGLSVYQEGVTNKELLLEEFDIYLLGHIQNPYPYLSRSDLFIKSSIYEGFPNVIIEAMACGLPIISSDCSSGPREILSPASDFMQSTNATEFAEYGILTPAYDTHKKNRQTYIDCACEAILSVLENEDRKTHYQKQSLKRSMDFEKELIIEQWIKLIE